MNVHIIQPLIPLYRVPLFTRLAACDDLHVRVSASMTHPGVEDGLSSEKRGFAYEDLDHPCITFWGDRFMWQRGLRLDADMGPGDVLVISGNLRFLSNIPLIWKARRRGVGIVWWGHGFSRRHNRFRDAIRRVFLHFSDVILLYTDKEVREYKRSGFPGEKLFATNNSIDQAPIREATAAWDKTRLEEFRRREDLIGKQILLFCGRRTDSVSLDLVFSAVARLRKTHGGLLYVIIGPDDENQALKTQAAELGIEDCVRWLGPIYDQHALAPWYLSATCFVFPGSIGLSLIHSFSYGLPAIVPDCRHFPEIAAFRDGENGLFYREGDVEDLTERISSVIRDPAYRQRLSAEALRSVERDYNMDNMVQRFREAIYAAAGCRGKDPL